MLFNIIKYIFGFISSNIVLIINICYYIKKFNYHELFNESSSKDLIQLNIHLNLIDVFLIALLYVLFNSAPYFKRFLFQDVITNEKQIIETYIENFLKNKNKFKIVLVDENSILIESNK